jgi:1-acyl-sn-glycerol-3-phosphate acyltransferase
MRRALVFTTLLYRKWFRVETHGIENVPDGRVLVIGNHAGQIALDAAMIGTATVLEREPPRILRAMGEYWLPTVPFVNLLMTRTGSVVGTPKNCIDLLNQEEAVMAFPEGIRGMNKLFSERYRLQRFGFGFMRLALATRTPIVPVAVVGSEEQAPGDREPEGPRPPARSTGVADHPHLPAARPARARPAAVEVPHLLRQAAALRGQPRRRGRGDREEGHEGRRYDPRHARSGIARARGDFLLKKDFNAETRRRRGVRSRAVPLCVSASLR